MRYATQIIGNRASDEFPKTIDYGGTGSFKIFFSDFDWPTDFAADFLRNASEKEVRTLKAQIFTSVGQTKEVVPTKGVFERLLIARAEAIPD